MANIMIVDDSSIIRRSLREIFEKMGQCNAGRESRAVGRKATGTEVMAAIGLVRKCRMKGAVEIWEKQREPLRPTPPALSSLRFELVIKDGRGVLIIQRHIHDMTSASRTAAFKACTISARPGSCRRCVWGGCQAHTISRSGLSP